MEPTSPPPALKQIQNHYHTMKNSLENHYAQITAVQEELISSQSHQLHTYEQKFQNQGRDIEDLQREVARLREVLNSIVDTVGPLYIKKSPDTIKTEHPPSNNRSPAPGTEPLHITIPHHPGSRGPLSPPQVNKQLPPRPNSINTTLINDLNSLIIELQPPTPPHRMEVVQQPPSPGFYNPSSPKYDFAKPTTAPVPPLTRTRAVTDPPALRRTAGSEDIASFTAQLKRHSSPLPPAHEATLPSTPVARAVTPDEFFRRLSPRMRFRSHLRLGSKAEVLVEEPDEVIRAKVREEAERRKKKAFVGVERVVRSGAVHSILSTGAEGIVRTGSPQVGGGVEGSGAQGAGIVYSRAASLAGSPRVGNIISRFREGNEIGTGAEFENIIGLGSGAGEAVVEESPLLEKVGSIEGKQIEPKNMDRVRDKLKSKWADIWH